MDSSQRDKKPSMTNLLSGVVDRMLRLQPVVVDDRMQNLAQKQANIRAVGVREGFQSIRARSDAMNERLSYYRRQHAAMIARQKGFDIAPPDDSESDAIVIPS